MNHLSNFPRRRNVRPFIAAIISYVLLAGQVAPLALAVAPSRTARDVPASVAMPSTQVEFAQRRNAPAPIPPGGGGTNAVAAPIITATKVDAFPSHPSGKANPGDVITYTVTVANTGSADATGVQFNDSVDTNTTLVAGSVQTQPIANPDAYNVIGNVRIQPNAAAGLLANDRDPDTGNNTGLTASGPTTTTQGGNITINADGSFSYNPAPGFAGTDTVTYTITDATSKTDTAVATFSVGNGTATPGTNVVWFVNPAAAAGGDGRLTNPFNCYTGASTSCFSQTAADDPGDAIFLFSGAHTGGNTLLNTQKLVGAGASDTLANLAGLTVPTSSDALPSTGGASPTITTTNVNAIPLAQGNLLRGFTVGNTGTGAKIIGSSFGTLTVGNSTTPDVTLNGTGKALDLTTGAFAATSGFSSITTTSSATQGISLAGITGTVSFGSTTVSGSTTQGILIGTTTADINFGNTSITNGTDGISFQNNSSGTRTIGTLSITNGSGVGFLHAVGGGAVTVGGQTTITNPGGRCVDIQNSTTAISFANLNATQCGGTGVFINNNTVGGTVSFGDFDVSPDAGQRAVHITNNLGTISSTSGTITGSATVSGANSSVEIAGTSAAARTPISMTLDSISSTNDLFVGINIHDVSGSMTVTTTTITNTGNGVAGNGIGIQLLANVSGTLNFGSTTINGTGFLGTRFGTNATDGNSGNITFGLLNIAPDSGTGGFQASFNTGTITTTSGTISTTNATAVNIAGTSAASRTPLNMQLTTVNTTGGATAPNGIRLVNTSATGSPGGFRVLGTGGTCNATTPTCTGGRITNTTGADSGSAAPSGAGVSLDNAATVVLNSMRIDTNTNYGIRGSVVSAFTLSNSLVATNGDNQATPFNDSSIRFDNMSGTSSINTSEVSGGFQRNIYIDNTIGTVDLTVTSCNIHNTSNTQGDDGLLIEIGTDTGASNATVHVTNNTFSAHGGDHFDFTVLGTPTVSVVFTGNNGNPGSPIHPIGLGQGFRIGAGAFDGTLTYDMSNNTVNGTKQGNAMTVNKGSGIGTFSGRVSGNTIGLTGQTLSGASQSNGINVESRGGGSHTTLVTNNTIRQYRDIGINIEGAEAGTTTMNATVTGNIIDEPGSPGAAGLSLHGIQLNWGIDPGNTSTACVDIGSSTAALKNNIPNSGNEPAGGFDIRARQRQSTTVRLPGYAGANNDNAAVNAYLTARNTLTSVSATQTVPTGGGYVNTPGGAQCPQPTIPTGPATIDGTDGDTPGGPGGIGTQTATTTAQPTGNNVTSRPFVSPRPIAPRTATPAATTTARPASTTPAAATTATTTRTTTDPVVINGAGGTVSVNIGTLRAGDSVTITFQVTIDNPYSGGPNVSNQGTVSGTNFSNVLTDDPALGGAADPTLTPIDSININARDAKAAEPATGQSTMLFTVTLSAPATSNVTVNFATADDTPAGPGKAVGGASCVAGVDYLTTFGTLSFAIGQQVKTVSVSVCSDAVADDNETLLLNLSGAVGGTIQDGQAVGTITANTAGTFLISELRTSGPAGLGDDFVELYNNTNSPLTVAASDASAGLGVFKMGADCNAAPVLIGTVPNGTVIPARGHFLMVGTQYSLSNYGGTGAAAGNLTLVSNIESDRNVAVFSTADMTAVSSANRLDAVGFDGNTGGVVCDLLREGTFLPPVFGSTTEHSFFRSMTQASGGNPKDTNDNAADFLFADTQGTFISGVTQHLGAPGPENLSSPIRRDTSGIGVSLLDNTKAASVSPNRVRDFTSTPANNSTFGTLSIRRRVTNTTGAPVTRLRFRIVDITTFPSPGGGVADLRAISSTSVSVSGVGDAGTCNPAATPCTVTVQGTTLEQPPNQPNGGGFNSTLSAGTVTLGTPLANNAAINVQFLLGVQTTGTFRFLIIVEALP